MTFIERISLAFGLIKSADGLEAVVSKIESLRGVLERLESIQKSLPDSSILEELASRLSQMDQIVRGIEQPTEIVPTAQVVKEPIKQDLEEWNRLKLLSKFVQLSGKAQEIESEWQRIQQDEHDYQFAFQTSSNEDTQAKYVYKKGISDGIKWCISKFS